MSLHVFANAVTTYGTAANNRAETEGNITTLQKIIWQGQPHTTVSAEAIRFALRRQLAQLDANGTNRRWNEDLRVNEWQDHKFSGWQTPQGKTFPDDDLLGFMTAEAASEEGTARSRNARRAVLELTRAVSLTPWPGDVTFNAASPGATPSAQKRGQNPVPYGTEVHATRYQFGLALTPERLREKRRASMALRALGALRTVAGNHARFLYDFAPEVIVFRLTDDPAPRLLYCFETSDDGRTVEAPSLLERVRAGDVKPDELVFGGSRVAPQTAAELQKCGATVYDGVKQAIDDVCQRIDQQLGARSS